MPILLAQATHSQTRRLPRTLKPQTQKPPARDREMGHPLTRKPATHRLPVQTTHRLPVQNRVHVLLVHIPAFSIQGQARLADSAGVARSTISRLVNGRLSPSYRLARAVTDALEKRLGQPLDIRDVFTTNGTYPTPSGCALCQCKGCLPEEAWGEDNVLKSEWRDARPGDWSIARPADVLVPTDVLVLSDVLVPTGSNIHADSIAGAGKGAK